MPPYCSVCGRPGCRGLVCDNCQLNPPEFSGLRSWSVYGGEIRNAIHRLKYNNDIALGDLFSDYLVRLYQKQNWQVDMVIPVPLSRERIKQRGYNQSSILARPLAMQLNLPFVKKALFRQRDTRSQIGLSAQDRKINVWGAFRAESSLIQDQNVLLVDDVTTTGATLNACAYALNQAGAQHVNCLTLARSG